MSSGSIPVFRPSLTNSSPAGGLSFRSEGLNGFRGARLVAVVVERVAVIQDEQRLDPGLPPLVDELVPGRRHLVLALGPLNGPPAHLVAERRNARLPHHREVSFQQALTL